MENFKEIAEKCLAGELSGTFVLRNGKEINSEGLIRSNSIHFPYTFFDKPFTYTNKGSIYKGFASPHECDIVNFIPDQMVQKKIEIDIPEGKVPVMEQTEKGVVITWKEKELTYTELSEKFKHNPEFIHSSSINSTSRTFYKKVEVFRKLTNIRNYFGKPKHNTYGYVLYYTIERGIYTIPAFYPSNDQSVIFDTKEHAEQAIKMLGDELNYLFEPW